MALPQLLYNSVFDRIPLHLNCKLQTARKRRQPQVPFDMTLTSCGNVVPEQLFGRPAVYPGDGGYFGDPFLSGQFELEDYSCSNYALSSHGNYVLASDDLELLYPKRQRTEGSVLFTELPPLMVEAPAEFLPFPNECCCYSGVCENEYRGIGAKKRSAARPSPSAQSMAARERRRKITEKTTELGRLIPGGRKMTTAEMLQAAHKYVRFLQAQVNLLQLIQPNDEAKEEVPRYQPGHIGTFLGSSRIQEKLYAEEKCLATKELVRSIMKNDEIRSSKGMLRDLEVVINSS